MSLILYPLEDLLFCSSPRLGPEDRPRGWKTVTLPLFVKRELFFNHHIWDISMGLNSRGSAEAGWVGRSVAECIQGPPRCAQVQREWGCKYNLWFQVVSPRAITHSRGTGCIGETWFKPCLCLYCTLDPGKITVSVVSNFLCSNTQTSSKVSSSYEIPQLTNLPINQL